MHPASKLKDSVEFWAAVLAIVAAIYGAVAYVVPVFIVSDHTEDYREEVSSKIIPLVEMSDLGDEEVNSAISRGDAQAFYNSSIAFADRLQLQGKIILAVEAAEKVITCEKKLTCKVDYDRTLQIQLRRFWYFYRPKIETLRASIVPRNFGSVLELEAKQILISEREEGSLPKPQNSRI